MQSSHPVIFSYFSLWLRYAHSVSEILKYFATVAGIKTWAVFAKLLKNQKFLPLTNEKKLVKPSQVLLDSATFPEVQELSPHFVTVKNLHGPMTNRTEELRSLGAKDEVTLEVVITILNRYEEGHDIDNDERERILVKTCLQESMSSKHLLIIQPHKSLIHRRIKNLHEIGF